MGRIADFVVRALRGRINSSVRVSIEANHEINANRNSLEPLLSRPGRHFLHVGCGPARKPNVAPGLIGEDWNEIRLDIDPATIPDVIGSMVDMHPISSGTMHAVYSSHNIEHLYSHEVPLALAEMRRVLLADGLLILTCPDIQAVCQQVVEGKLNEVLYVSPAGPITPLDILFGHRPQLAAGNHYMAHRTGFSQQSLADAIRDAGFPSVAVKRRESSYDLWAVASKSMLDAQTMQSVADSFWPQ